MTTIEVITLIVAVIVAIGVILTCWATFRAANAARDAAQATKDAAEAELLYSILTEYFSHEMNYALQALKGSNVVDKDRRTVKAYFYKAARLRMTNLIQLKTFDSITYVDGNLIYYDIVYPLDEQKNPALPSAEHTFLLEYMPPYDASKEAAELRALQRPLIGSTDLPIDESAD